MWKLPSKKQSGGVGGKRECFRRQFTKKVLRMFRERSSWCLEGAEKWGKVTSDEVEEKGREEITCLENSNSKNLFSNDL